MKRTLPIFFILVLCSCAPVSAISTPTSINSVNQAIINNTVIASETPIISSYPPCAPIEINQKQTPAPPIPINPPRKLTNGLTIVEYRPYIYSIYMQNSGCRYADHMFADTTINLNPSYQIVIQPLDVQSELVKVLKGGLDVFNAKTLTYGSSGLLQAWSYNDHWVIEIKTNQWVDIIRDGQSLKEVGGYDKVFAFQLLDHEPFYFFRKNQGWGINYNNREFQLDYDDIPYTNVSDGMDPTVFQYQNMVLFQAKRNNENYSVVIGVFRWKLLGSRVAWD